MNTYHYITTVADANTWQASIATSGTGNGNAAGTVIAKKAGGIGQTYFTRGRFARTPASITSFISLSSTATITFPSNHGLVNGDKIIVAGSSTSNSC